MNVHVRKYSLCDIEPLTSLIHELGYSHTKITLSDHIQKIRQRGGEIFVAERGGILVGCVCAIIDIRLAAGVYGELVSLIVTEKARGAGVGKNLVRHAEGWLGKRVDIIRVRANSIRSEAHGFYISRGYKEKKMQKIFVKTV